MPLAHSCSSSWTLSCLRHYVGVVQVRTRLVVWLGRYRGARDRLLSFVLSFVIVCHVKNSYNVHRYALGLRSDTIGSDVSVMRQGLEWLRIVVGSCSQAITY